jgi:hypothetical protein
MSILRVWVWGFYGDRNSISILTSLKATLKVYRENGSDDLKKLVWQVLTILVKLRHKVRVGELLG